jgi:hypothetical protein
VKVNANKRVREKVMRKNKKCFLEVGIILGDVAAAGCWSNAASHTE